MQLTNSLAICVVLAFSYGALVFSWLYFRRYRVVRPPVGVFNLSDITFMVCGIVLVPYLYLALPAWVVVLLLAGGTLSLVYFLWEPISSKRTTVLVVSGATVVVDLCVFVGFGSGSNLFFAVNNFVLVASVVSLTNLWVQSGMKARDITVLALFLTAYDLAATWLMPLMFEVLTHLATLPFSPMVVWRLSHNGPVIGLGLGDLLLASAFPLVLRKAFSHQAGIVAMIVAALCLLCVLLLPTDIVFPVMIVLGPLMVVQYAYWSRREGKERSTREYLLAEPVARDR